MSLYLILNLGSIAIPLVFSFHPRIKFYERFFALVPAIVVSGITYLSWDIIFTKSGIWGFNPTYLLGTNFLYLPIEEWLFFICIPFACVFTHYTIIGIFPNVSLKASVVKLINWFVIGLLTIVVLFNIERAYTATSGILALMILIAVMKYHPKILNAYYITFLLMLIPFFVVNGILTGSFIAEQVVWYNDAANLGIRLFTIPVEDISYAFGLILLNIFLVEIFYKKEEVANQM